ncbi:hypothetical protein ACIPIN_22785 [Pseudomonas sp. NPDC087697]|uniref:hypothetical protein n=1 Tax=Pseudomonas sp. NPDC087697 TaxID=3364447 RepID=UPI0037F428CC
MSIGAISASNPVTINGLRSAQSQPKAQADQATASTSVTTVASNVAAALKEATETAAQTAQEAGHGDHQAQLLMQKQHQQHVGAATPSKAPSTGVVNGNGQITGVLINTKA